MIRVTLMAALGVVLFALLILGPGVGVLEIIVWFALAVAWVVAMFAWAIPRDTAARRAREMPR